MGSKVSRPVKLPRPAPPYSTEDYTPRDSQSLYSRTNPSYVKHKNKFKWKPKKHPEATKTDQSEVLKLAHQSTAMKQANQSEAANSARDEQELNTTFSDDTVTEIDVDVETRTELIPSSLSSATLKGRTKPKPQFNGFIQNQDKETFVRQLEIERQVKQQELHQRQV